MPLHEVVVRQNYFNQEIINRYNYVSSGTPAAVTRSFGLAAAMGFVLSAGVTNFDVGTLAEAQQKMQVPDAEFVDILVKDVYNPVDFYTTAFPPGVNGTFSTGGAGVSPAVSYGFRSSRSRLDIKRGFKRFVGVNEDKVNAGGQINADWLINELQTLANRLGDTLSYDDEGNTISYQPVIVSKFKYTTPSGRNAYQYYPESEGGEVEQLLHVADANVWQPYQEVRTQVSRQYGRGR